MGRFDYIQYDEKACARQASFKDNMAHIERMIEANIHCPRSKALSLTALEEVYMWIGKGIRNDQIARSGTPELLEERSNS